jgi:molybdenum cofactor cytidylyltransferase
MTSRDEGEQIGVAILAAGASRRLGLPKQLLRLDGCTLLERTILAALAVPACWPVVVVLGAHAAHVRPVAVRHPVLIADNPAHAEGMASSLRTGLLTLQQFSRRLSAVLFLLADQPALAPAILERMLAERRRTGSSVVTAHYEGHPGAPALIGREYFGTIAGLTGDEGARQLFHRLPPGMLVAVQAPELAVDIDTPEDVARLGLEPPAGSLS